MDTSHTPTATARTLDTGDELAFLDGTATAALIAAGELSPLEAVDAAIERIERVNPAVNAVVHRQYERARAAAAGPLPEGPMRGVPFLVKDAVCHFDGDPEHFGMRVLRDVDHRAVGDTWLAQRFRAAGFVTLGRTNVPEMATSITTEPEATGATRNPWDLNRSSGGSSGGSAAAVASGMVPIAHGNDMGGSIRIPAAHCGLVGLKPTRGRTSLAPEFGELWGPTTHQHVLTRSVRDSAAVLDAIAGAAPGDPYTAPAPARPFLSEVGADPGSLRVGWRTDRCDGTGSSHPDCVAAVEAAASLMQTLGHRVQQSPVAALDEPTLGQQLPLLFAVIVAREVDRWSERIGRPIALDELEAGNAFLAEMGRSVSGAHWLAGLEGVQRWTRGVAAWFEDGYDVLVTPMSPEPPPLLGDVTIAGQGDAFPLAMRNAGLMTFSFAFNITGQPAMSLPLGWSDSGLPIGVQLVAPTGREDTLFRLAAQLEQAQPWGHRRPPTSA